MTSKCFHPSSLLTNTCVCLPLRFEPVQSLRMQIRTTTMPPTVSSCTWMWVTRCVCSWTGAKSTGATPINTAPSLASSSTPIERTLTFHVLCLYFLFQTTVPPPPTPFSRPPSMTYIQNEISHFTAVQQTKHKITEQPPIENRV